MIDDTLLEAEEKMDKAVSVAKEDFTAIRTGRVHPSLFNKIVVDYYGTSLHKWLLAPIGTGFLYVRKAKIGGIWPMMAAPATMNDNIRKYEEIGTHPAANHNAISAALAFHRGIGSERKIARLKKP